MKIVDIAGTKFEITPALEKKIEAALTAAGKEIDKIWPGLSHPSTTRMGARNVIKAYMDEYR